MFERLFSGFKQLFQNEDILFAYRREVGLVDAQGIENYLGRNRVEKIYIFTESEVVQQVRENLTRFPEVEIIKTEDMKRAMADKKKDLPDKKIRQVDLDNFGVRPIQNDAC
jgi:hypothetical protein